MNAKENICKTLKPYSKYTDQLTRPTLRTIIQICVHYFETNTYSEEVLKKAIIKLSNTADVGDLEHFHFQFTAIQRLFELYLRTSKGTIKDDDLAEILKELRLDDTLAQDVTTVLQKHRDNLTACLRDAKQLHLGSPNRLVWRINISLPDRTRHTIVLQLKSSDNSVCHTIEVSIAQFHKLRYQVALLLNQMQVLESRAIMKK